ncbi:hypothetical protein ACFFRR_007568 [Megaselia abdita]
MEFESISFYSYSLKDIPSTEWEKNVVLNVRVRNNTQYLNLTVIYNDSTEDVLYLSSLKARTTFKFYDFEKIHISSKDVEFCLNYQLSNYTIPEIEEPVSSTIPFKMWDDHLTVQINQEGNFSENNTELILCEQLNLYKIEFGKEFEDCDINHPNKTTQIFRHAKCPTFWENSESCYQFTFRVLISEKIIPKNIILDDHMKNALSNTNRYLDQQELKTFWDSMNSTAINKYERSFFASSSNIMLIVAAIIGILVLAFFILVAIFRSPVFNDKFNNDIDNIIQNEEKKEEIDFTIEMGSPQQVVPDFYGAHSNSAFITEEPPHNNFDSITEEESNNETELKDIYATVTNKRNAKIMNTSVA